MQEDGRANLERVSNEEEVVDGQIFGISRVLGHVVKKHLDHAGVEEGRFFLPLLTP
jgi:uncharacterized protein YlaN (UPF0358 family)